MTLEKKYLFIFFSAIFLSLVLFLSFIYRFDSLSDYSSRTRMYPPIVRRGSDYPPTFAYYIFGNREKNNKIFRLLLSVYHPRNRYLIHLAHDAPEKDRAQLAILVRSVPAMREFGNVDVIGKPDRGTFMGSTTLAAVLHAASVLLRIDSNWDWFITLSASDYPLVTQDDLSHALSHVNRELNFIDHTSDLGWKETQRFRPIVVDPALYLARERNQIFHATEIRPSPESFTVFTGSPWNILSRPFIEYCILGWDNLPRTLLMYFSNVQLSQEAYFHSVACNSPDFRNLTINSDLRFMVWDIPPKMEPRFLNETDYEEMAQSGSAFARQFHGNEPVLDTIDQKILDRGRDRVAPGAWCSGKKTGWTDPCSHWGNVNVLKPGPRAQILKESIAKLLENWNSSQSNWCK